MKNKNIILIIVAIVVIYLISQGDLGLFAIGGQGAVCSCNTPCSDRYDCLSTTEGESLGVCYAKDVKPTWYEISCTSSPDGLAHGRACESTDQCRDDMVCECSEGATLKGCIYSYEVSSTGCATKPTPTPTPEDVDNIIFVSADVSKYEVTLGDQVYIEAKIKANKGGTYVIEGHLDDYSNIQALISIVSNYCDDYFGRELDPNYMNDIITFSAGETKTIRLYFKPEKIGEYALNVVALEDCYYDVNLKSLQPNNLYFDKNVGYIKVVEKPTLTTPSPVSPTAPDLTICQGTLGSSCDYIQGIIRGQSTDCKSGWCQWTIDSGKICDEPPEGSEGHPDCVKKQEEEAKTTADKLDLCLGTLGQECIPPNTAVADGSGPSVECNTGWCQDVTPGLYEGIISLIPGVGDRSGICAMPGIHGDGKKKVGEPHQLCEAIYKENYEKDKFDLNKLFEDIDTTTILLIIGVIVLLIFASNLLKK